MIPCVCQAERKIRSRLPERYWNARLSDFSQEIGEVVLHWLTKPTDGLLLIGPAGTGKTHLACAIVRELLSTRQDCVFRRCDDLYEDVRNSYGNGANSRDVLKPFIGKDGECNPVRFVVLDDVGAGNLGDFERRILLQITEIRGNRLRPTIVTTNWSIQQIAERIMEDRITSRFSSYTRLELAGKDRRLELLPDADKQFNRELPVVSKQSRNASLIPLADDPEVRAASEDARGKIFGIPRPVFSAGSSLTKDEFEAQKERDRLELIARGFLQPGAPSSQLEVDRDS